MSSHQSTATKAIVASSYQDTDTSSTTNPITDHNHYYAEDSITSTKPIAPKPCKATRRRTSREVDGRPSKVAKVRPQPSHTKHSTIQQHNRSSIISCLPSTKAYEDMSSSEKFDSIIHRQTSHDVIGNSSGESCSDRSDSSSEGLGSCPDEDIKRAEKLFEAEHALYNVYQALASKSYVRLATDLIIEATHDLRAARRNPIGSVIDDIVRRVDRASTKLPPSLKTEKQSLNAISESIKQIEYANFD